MDLKKLGKLLLVLGLIIVVVGVFTFIVGVGIGTSTIRPYFIIYGIGILLSALGITMSIAGGIIIFVGHSKDIENYANEKVIPAAKKTYNEVKPKVKETVDKVTPKVKSAAKEVAKGVSNGIDAFKKN